MTNTPTSTDEWLSLNAASIALGISRIKLSREVIAGNLEGQSRGGMTFISQKSIDAYQAKQKKGAKK